MKTKPKPKTEIRSRRESEGLSLKGAALKSLISINHLSRVERGLASMSISSMLRLAKVLRVDPSWLAHQLREAEQRRKT